MINQQMGKIIDEIRQERKLSREDLCDDIMSIRNYQRFINEEVNLSNDKLSRLIDRLNLDYFTLREIYTHRSVDKYSQLHRIYRLMMANSDKEAYEELKKVSPKGIESAYMQLFYDYIKLDLERQLGVIPYEEAIAQLQELIDFPNVLDFEVLNFIELNVLAILNQYYTKKEDDKIANFLYNFINKEDLSDKGIMASFLPGLYSSTAQAFGSLGRYEQALEISEMGIKQCMKLQMFNNLYHLMYFKALSLQQLERIDEAKEVYKKLNTLFYALEEKDKQREYMPIIENGFKMKYDIVFKESELE